MLCCVDVMFIVCPFVNIKESSVYYFTYICVYISLCKCP